MRIYSSLRCSQMKKVLWIIALDTGIKLFGPSEQQPAIYTSQSFLSRGRRTLGRKENFNRYMSFPEA